MTNDETVEAMLATLKDIKDQQADDSTDSSDSPADGDCFACGSDNIKREVVAGNGANRTANRHVGGHHMRIRKVCRDCGHRWF